jgi:cation:H+ antiporter
MPHLNLILEFVVSAGIIWVAGVWLTRTTDAIDTKYKLGSAFGGLLILGVATSLPEIAIVISAAFAHHYDIIIGTLLGGIAIQTAAISLFDARMKVKSPLTFSAASLTLVLEAVIVILVTIASILAVKTPAVIYSRFSISSLLIFLVWVFGLWLIFRARKGLPWHSEAIQSHPGREYRERQVVINHPVLKDASTTKIFVIFAASALAILVSGVGLQSSGTQLANAWGIGAGLFAATFIALASALPDISTGISSVDIGDYKLAMSDIFGANAFMPALFVICDLIIGRPVLAHATSTDIWFAALGVLLTGVYIIGLIVRPKRTYFFGMGIDSILVLVLYILGILALTLTHYKPI